ncbi:MAG: FAD-dependent oxidoreductase [Rhodospirillales bacterium]|nr:MAG: FAD-dependent oxidoreductase [Rhodospirillales bacterium]
MSMTRHTPDIVIFGAGIAGLWAFHRYKRMGYDALLLESFGIGGGQTIASQGIVHSGLKYAFAGKINKLAQGISAMQNLWEAALRGEGDVDLSAAKTLSTSQYLMMNNKIMGEIIKLVTSQALGNNVHEVMPEDWPQEIKSSGFHGKVVFMDEPVLDIPSVLRALAEPYKDSIRKIDTPDDPFGFLKQHNIEPKHIIFTGAASNAQIAAKEGHNHGLHTQARPLLMGMLKPAPYPLFAHLVGHTDKPVASITTHTTREGELVWYLGGGAAERKKEADPQEVYDAVRKGFAKYLPAVDLSAVQWAALPIDRIEGKSGIDGWIPDTPTIHSHENVHYCWPTKLTFAPLLAERLLEKMDIQPSKTQSDWAFLPDIDYAETPWDEAQWTDGD